VGGRNESNTGGAFCFDPLDVRTIAKIERLVLCGWPFSTAASQANVDLPKARRYFRDNLPDLFKVGDKAEEKKALASGRVHEAKLSF